MKRFYSTSLQCAHKKFHITRCKKKSEANQKVPISTMNPSYDFGVLRALLYVFILFKDEKQWYYIEDKICEDINNRPGFEIFNCSKRAKQTDLLTMVCQMWYMTVALQQRNSLASKDCNVSSLDQTELLKKANMILEYADVILQLMEVYTSTSLHSSQCSESEISCTSTLSYSISSEDEETINYESRKSFSIDSIDSGLGNSSTAIATIFSTSDSQIDESHATQALMLIINVLAGDVNRIISHPQTAKALYEKAIKIDTEFTIPVFKLAQLQNIELQDVDAAFSNYSKCIDNFTEGEQFEKALIQRAEISYSKGLYEDALHDYSRAITQNNKIEYFYKRANIYTILNQHDLAIKDYENIIERDSTSSKAYIYKGLIHYDVLNDYTKANEDFSKAIEYGDRMDLLPYVYRGDLNRIYLNNLPLALDDYNIAVEIAGEKSLPSILVSRALLHDMMSNSVACLEDLTRSLTLDPQNIETYLIRSTHHFQQSRFEEALQDLQLILEIEPNHIEALIRRLDLCEFYLKDFPQAMHCVDQLIHLDSQNPLHYSRKDNLMAITFFQQFGPLSF